MSRLSPHCGDILGWTHFKRIIYLDDPLKRDFYAEMCRIERWSTRSLERKIGGMLFERTALSKKPKELSRRELDGLRAEDKLTPDLVFRDPYFLDFLGLKDRYVEKDIEDAIMFHDAVIQLFKDARVRFERVNSRGDKYSLAEDSYEEFIRWYDMPWE